MDFCRNRLPVAYNPDAPEPVRWKRFLSELLEPEDILTLQEYMGYCLLPTTKAQKMLMIIGKGGEGKSRIGVVVRALFGDNMANGNLAKAETNRFARADLEHLLVMVDDDMKLEALPHTNYIKTIITAELPLDLEKKSEELNYQYSFRIDNTSLNAMLPVAPSGSADWQEAEPWKSLEREGIQ
jgi:putative DNA primase/helicase